MFRIFAFGAVAGQERQERQRLFRPARRGLTVDVGEAGKMLRVLILGVPARDQRRIHVARGSVA